MYIYMEVERTITDPTIGTLIDINLIAAERDRNVELDDPSKRLRIYIINPGTHPSYHSATILPYSTCRRQSDNTRSVWTKSETMKPLLTNSSTKLYGSSSKNIGMTCLSSMHM